MILRATQQQSTFCQSFFCCQRCVLPSHVWPKIDVAPGTSMGQFYVDMSKVVDLSCLLLSYGRRYTRSHGFIWDMEGISL